MELVLFLKTHESREVIDKDRTTSTDHRTSYLQFDWFRLFCCYLLSYLLTHTATKSQKCRGAPQSYYIHYFHGVFFV